MTKKPTNWTGRDDAAVEHMIRRGASRREHLKMLMGSGVALAAGGALLTRATGAVAATREQSRLEFASVRPSP